MRSDFSLNTYSSFEALDSTTVVQSAVVIKMKLLKDISDQERLFPHQVEHSHTNTSFATNTSLDDMRISELHFDFLSGITRNICNISSIRYQIASS